MTTSFRPIKPSGAFLKSMVKKNLDDALSDIEQALRHCRYVDELSATEVELAKTAYALRSISAQLST